MGQLKRGPDMARKAKTTPPVPAEEAAAPMMKKPEILDAIVARTNLKKRDVKPAVEAAMAVIADALRDGNDINFPPLGKLRVVKSKDLEGGAAVMTLKLRTQKNATAAAGVVADDDSL